MNFLAKLEYTAQPKELARLVIWLKKEGYKLEDIEQLLKYIANLKDQ